MSKQSCPYCSIVFSLDGVDHDISFPHFERVTPQKIFGAAPRRGEEQQKNYRITSHRCPDCRKEVMWLTEYVMNRAEPGEGEDRDTILLFPKRRQKLLPVEIPEPYASEFLEAFYTLEISPKASAALSRRCLQLLIRGKEGIQERTLCLEVSNLIASNKLPRHLSDELDAIRNIGNFAAHPLKDTNTDSVIPVEPAEAEWTLGILEQLLCFYFIELPASQARRDALNLKLKNSGQKPML